MDLIVRIAGEIQESNFTEYSKEILAKIKSINTDLQTDEDFGQAEQLVKSLKAAEKAIGNAEKKALDETADIKELFQAMTDIKSTLAGTRLKLDKKIKARKVDIKNKIVQSGMEVMSNLIATHDAHPVAKRTFHISSEDFKTAVKGKKKVNSMKESVEKLIDKLTDDFQQHNDLITANAEILAPFSEEHPFIFVDEDNILRMAPDALQGVINDRIARAKAEEEARRIKAEAKKKEQVPDVVPEPTPEPVLPEIDIPVQSEPEPSTDHRYILTIAMACDKLTAIRIAEKVDYSLAEERENIVSISLNKK